MENRQLLLICRSLTYAQRSARALERKGVTAAVSRAPKEASQRGCAYCVIVSGKNGKRALDILRQAELPPERTMVREPDGALREADDDLS